MLHECHSGENFSLRQIFVIFRLVSPVVSSSHLSDSFEGGRVLKQQVHGAHVVLLASNVERCEAILETQRKQFTNRLRTCVCAVLKPESLYDF